MVPEFNAKEVRQVFQGVAPGFWEENGGEIHGVVGGTGHVESVGIEKSKVELDVVANNRAGAQKLGELGGNVGEGGRALDLAGPDAGEPLYVVGNGPARVDEGLEGIQHLVATEADGAYLEYGVPLGVQSGGFQVEGDVDLFQGGHCLVDGCHLAPVPFPCAWRQKV